MTILEVFRTEKGVEVNLLNSITSVEIARIQAVLNTEKSLREVDFIEGERLRKKYFG
jgi:hypothetical protein